MRFTAPLLLLGATLALAAPFAQDAPAPAPPSGGDQRLGHGPPPTAEEIQQAVQMKLAQEEQKAQGGGAPSPAPSGGSGGGPFGFFDTFLKPFESIFGSVKHKRQLPGGFNPLSMFEQLFSPPAPPAGAPMGPGQGAGDGAGAGAGAPPAPAPAPAPSKQ